MRRGRRTAPFLLHELHDLIAHLRFNGTELALDINAVLATESYEVFALHAQLARQSEDTNFLFKQAELPVLTNSAYPLPLRFSPSLAGRAAANGWMERYGDILVLSSGFAILTRRDYRVLFFYFTRLLYCFNCGFLMPADKTEP